MTFRSFWKGERWSTKSAREKRAQIAARAACREAVIARENGQCQRCFMAVRDWYPEWHPRRAHVHEIVPRSLGGDPTDPANCELLCQNCHMPNGRHAVQRRKTEEL